MPVTGAESEAPLFAGFGSLAVVATAVFVTAGSAAGPTDTLSVNESESSGGDGSEPANVAVTICPFAPKLKPAPLPDAYVSPAGSVSTTVIAPVAAVPTFRTRNKYVAGWPTVMFPMCRFSSATSGSPLTSARSASALFEKSMSPVVSTYAWFVTDGSAAGPIETRTSHDTLAPGTSGPCRVAVTSCPFAVNVQPAPLPDTYVSPAGSVSTTVNWS